MPDASAFRATVDGAGYWAPPRDDGWPGDDPPPHDCQADEPMDRLEDLTDPTTLHGIDPPEREYVIAELAPKSAVTLLVGPGGTGKSLIGLQAQIACAVGRDFLGFETRKCRTLGFYCEDDADEMHRRAQSICIHYGVWMKDLGLARWQGRFGRQNVVAMFKDGVLTPTLFFDFIVLATKATKATKAELLILDNIAQLFAGNENDRSMVTQFVNLLGRIAIELRVAVLLLGHPGKSPVGLTAEFSGSTAWDAAARLRWFLGRPPAEDGAEVDTDLRVLSKRKSNYSAIGDEITLKWDRGAFAVIRSTRPDTVDRIDANAKVTEAQEAFLAAMDKLASEGRKVTSKRRAGNYAPNEMIKMPAMKGYRRVQIEKAMQALFDAGRISEVPYGPPSRGWTELVRVQNAT